jgi:hypothetical protein
MKYYCVGYEYVTGYETEWFKAENKKEAIKKAREIVGSDVKVTHVLEQEENENA